MAIPAGPFPAPIDWADLRVGMHVLVTFAYHATGESLTADVVVDRIDANGAYARTSDMQVVNPVTWNDPTRDETIQLLEAFTGDPNEPPVGTVVKAASGTIYQRAAAADPTASTWYATNSTAAVSWSDITAAGAAQIILDGSTL